MERTGSDLIRLPNRRLEIPNRKKNVSFLSGTIPNEFTLVFLLSRDFSVLWGGRGCYCTYISRMLPPVWVKVFLFSFSLSSRRGGMHTFVASPDTTCDSACQDREAGRKLLSVLPYIFKVWNFLLAGLTSSRPTGSTWRETSTSSRICMPKAR